VFLIREAGGSGPFLNTPNSSIGTGGSDFQPGGRVALIKHRDAAFDYEIAYLGFGSNSGFDFASGNLRGSGVAPAGSEIAFATPVALNGSGIYLSHLQSSFNSLEFNVRENVSDYLTILAGFRWINLNERFGFLLASPTDAIAGVTEATNNLLGFQVGADGVLYDMGRFQIDGIAKAGIYGNLADNQTAVIGVPNPGFIAFTDDTTDVAFEADVRLGGTYWLGERFAVRGGYQLIWLEGVALAADQIAAVDLNNRWGLDTSGSPFWHGAYVEAMLTW
jgi:hypothetical protein